MKSKVFGNTLYLGRHVVVAGNLELLVLLLGPESERFPVFHHVDTQQLYHRVDLNNLLVQPLGGGNSILHLTPLPDHTINLWHRIAVLIFGVEEVSVKNSGVLSKCF